MWRKKSFVGVSFFVVWSVVVGSVVYADTLGFWTFDDINYGNTAAQNAGFKDSSKSKLTGVIGTPFSEVASAPGVTGKTGDFALRLDGKGGLWADDSATKSLNFQPPFTIEAWIRSDEDLSSAHYGIVSYGIPGGRDGGGGWKLSLNNGNLGFTMFAVVDLYSNNPVPIDGAWHHIAVGYSDQGFVSYYVDGEEVSVVDETRAVDNDISAYNFNIGTQFDTLNRFPGDIDRVRVTGAFLAAADLDSKAAEIKPVTDKTLAYFDFDEGKTPYASKGTVSPAYSAISSRDWALGGAIPRNMTGMPTVAEESPSGNAGDFSLAFDATQTTVQQAWVADPKGILDFSSGDYTLEAWVNTDLAYPEPAGDERGMIFYYGAPGKGYSMSITAAGLLQVTTLGIADMPSTKALVPVGEWAHVAVSVIAGKSVNYFINGKLIETRNYTNKTNAAGGGFLYIGAEWNAGLPFSGSIDRIRISNRALDASELDAKATQVSVNEWSLYE